MKSVARASALALLVIPFLLGNTRSPRTLSIDQRIQAQEAIERVYYAHQIGAVEPFERVVTRELLERKVRTYLKQSVALETVWSTPVTAEMLRAEQQRIARSTRMPDRLRELHEALGEDPYLILECLVRSALVDRLARSFLSGDERFQRQAKRRAEMLRQDLVEGRLDWRADEPHRRVEALSDEPPAPAAVGEIGAASERDDAFVSRVPLEEREGAPSIATYTLPKMSWEDWWSAASAGFDEDDVRPVADAASVESPGAMVQGDCEHWKVDVGYGPVARTGHLSVWTGSLMLVWGGDGTEGGDRYDPA